MRPVPRDERAQHRDRLRGDDGDQPGPGEPFLEMWLVALDREGGEDRVGETDPEQDAEREQRDGSGKTVRHQQDLGAEDRAGSDGGEKSGPEAMVRQVGEEEPRIAEHPACGQHHEHGKGENVEGEEGKCQCRKIDVLGRNRNDPGRHDEREIGGRQILHLRPVARPAVDQALR